jgi:hypothetical protein
MDYVFVNFFFYCVYRYRSVEQDWRRAEDDIWA